MKRQSVVFVTLVALAVLTIESCNTSSTDPIVGTWALQSINGASPSSIGISSETLTFDSSGTLGGTEVFVSGASTSLSGVWSVSGSGYVIVQTYPTNSTFAGAIAGNTLVMTSGGATAVYVKE